MHPTFRRTVAGLAGLAALCLGSSCATRPAQSPRPSPALVWPAPPDEPRIAYVRSLQSPADFGVKPSVFGRFARWLTGEANDGGPFIKPFGIALDDQANLCFTDTGANAVYCFNPASTTLSRWEQVGSIRFIAPVAVAKHGPVLYVADSARGSVVVFDEQGRLISEIKAGLQRPSGLTIVSNRLFVADSKAQSVLIFDLQGQPAGQIGQRGDGEGEFNFPTHICSDTAGRLYVTDSINGRVQIFDTEGQFLRQIGRLGDVPGRFSRPKGLATDRHDHLYVLDANLDNVQVFDLEGHLLMILGGAGNQPGEFWLPNGIAISANNEIYIADSYNRRIQVFKFIGQP